MRGTHGEATVCGSSVIPDMLTNALTVCVGSSSSACCLPFDPRALRKVRTLSSCGAFHPKSRCKVK